MVAMLEEVLSAIVTIKLRETKNSSIAQ